MTSRTNNTAIKDASNPQVKTFKDAVERAEMEYSASMEECVERDSISQHLFQRIHEVSNQRAWEVFVNSTKNKNAKLAKAYEKILETKLKKLAYSFAAKIQSKFDPVHLSDLLGKSLVLIGLVFLLTYASTTILTYMENNMANGLLLSLGTIALLLIIIQKVLTWIFRTPEDKYKVALLSTKKPQIRE